jgi:D-sedoheptulose 7-phosphate isomerase
MISDESARNNCIRKYLTDIRSALDLMPIDSIVKVIKALQRARIEGKTVYVFGNGGSAATASHCACDFSKGTHQNGMPGLKVISLTDNVPLITAWANDESYDQIFTRQLENIIERDDIAIGISVSGNSVNVLNCIKVANELGAVTIGFTSKTGGKLKDIVNIPVRLPVDDMEQAEDLHLILEHIITVCLREESKDLCTTYNVQGKME